MVTATNNLSPTGSLITDSLGGAGHIAFDPTTITPVQTKRKEIEDYIRLRLGDGMVDVELDPAHYKMAIDRALNRYRQRAQNSQEEAYAFLDLLPETQEYILPAEIMNVRQVFRRGIGSTTGTTATQFEPFASGYLNTYMLVAGRVGGLSNYELFVDYQKLAMTMFGGYINFTWNPVTKKITIVRKIPDQGHNYKRLTSLSASGTTPGSIITLTVQDSWPQVIAGKNINIINTPFSGWNGSYQVQSVSNSSKTFTLIALDNLAGGTSITGFDLSKVNVYSPSADASTESVLLWIDNYKPDSMLLADFRVFPWIQDYALAIAKDSLGQAREKFAQIAGPQGGTTLNGASLKQEAKTEMDALEEELKRFYDGSAPYTWITG